MRTEGFEPPLPKEPAPKAGASASSATLANRNLFLFLIIYYCNGLILIFNNLAVLFWRSSGKSIYISISSRSNFQALENNWWAYRLYLNTNLIAHANPNRVRQFVIQSIVNIVIEPIKSGNFSYTIIHKIKFVKSFIK